MDKSFPTNRLQMTLAELRRASERTLIVRLKFADGETFMYRPGQFVGLEAPDGRPRYFSVANAIPVGNELELHVNRAPAGAFTGALFAEAQVGDQLWVEGPFGEFRIPPEAPNEIILVAGGTGFAPLRACLELLAADEKARPGAGRRIHLYWGARSLADLYDIASILALSKQLPGLRFVPVLGQGHPNISARTGLVHRAIIEDFADLSNHDIFACGPPAMIEALANDCASERGFNASRLTADIFVTGPACEAITPPTEGAAIELHLKETGGPREIRGVEGEALVFALKRANVALLAVCGGKGACGTCRIHIAPAWRSLLSKPAKREARLLQHTGADEGDRLACQIRLSAGLGGLELQTCAGNKGDAQ